MNNFKNKSGELKPREQMERAASPHSVPSEAILAILLRTGSAGCDVMELSRRLIVAFGSIQRLVTSDWRTIEARIEKYNAEHKEKPILGLGHVKCLELAAAFELGYRAARPEPEEVRLMKVTSAREAYRLFRTAALEQEEQECFWVLPLNARKHPICEPICLFRGSVDSSRVYAREVFRDAVRWSASYIYVAHNHPSGDPTPSKKDVALTKTLRRLARSLEIGLLDHLVIGAVDSNDGLGYVSIL